MLRTQEGYLADRVIYPTERCRVEARLRDLRPVVLALRHEAIAYAVMALLLLVASVVHVIFPVRLFWGAVLGGAFGLFTSGFAFAFALYREVREELACLCSARLVLIMEEMHDEKVQAWVRRCTVATLRTKEGWRS